MTPEEIKRIRKASGLTQKEFGTRIKMSGRTVEKYERGDVRPSRVVQDNILAVDSNARMVPMAEYKVLLSIAFSHAIVTRDNRLLEMTIEAYKRLAVR